MTTDNIAVIVVLLILALCISAFLYNSYFGIRVRQKGLEKTFNKNVLKSAGFSALSKRIFEFCFDLFIFWLFFYYKDGIVFSWTKSILQVVYEKIIFILPISIFVFNITYGFITFPSSRANVNHFYIFFKMYSCPIIKIIWIYL